MQSILTKLFPLSEKKTQTENTQIFQGLAKFAKQIEKKKTVFDTSMERIDFMRMSYKNPNSPHTPRRNSSTTNPTTKHRHNR